MDGEVVQYLYNEDDHAAKEEASDSDTDKFQHHH
jgi:hypothetical protein